MSEATTCWRYKWKFCFIGIMLLFTGLVCLLAVDIVRAIDVSWMAQHSDEFRRLQTSSDAFAVVHHWISSYNDVEEVTHKVGTMEPTKHVLYGMSVPINIEQASITKFIVGGEPTETAASWMVMLLQRDSDSGPWFFAGCSGTLIASKYVLTAAHCVLGELSTSTQQNAVLVQAFRPFESGNGGLRSHFSYIESFEVHEEYASTRFDKDVALIKLSRRVDTSRFPALRLAGENFQMMNGDLVTVYGFGMTEEEAADHSSVLRQVDVPFVTADSCRRYHGYQITDDMVCAGLQDGGKDACNGDSGGPLVTKIDENSMYQVGIVSWGDGCARPNSPGVYSSVSFFYRWISNRVCKDGDMQVELAKTLCQIETETPTSWPISEPTPSPIIPTVSPMLQTSAPTSTIRTQLPVVPMEMPTSLEPSESSAVEQLPTSLPRVDSPLPTISPTLQATNPPTTAPTHHPTNSPFASPTRSPFTRPTRTPSRQPTRATVPRPTRSPFALPTRVPLSRPTRQPTKTPVAQSPAPTTLPIVTCLGLDHRCLPWSGPSCCTGNCLQWWGNNDDGFFICSDEEDFGKRSKSKKKKRKSDGRR